MTYSALSLLRHGLRVIGLGTAWRAPEPKRAYDVVIVGAAAMASPLRST